MSSPRYPQGSYLREGENLYRIVSVKTSGPATNPKRDFLLEHATKWIEVGGERLYIERRATESEVAAMKPIDPLAA